MHAERVGGAASTTSTIESSPVKRNSEPCSRSRPAASLLRRAGVRKGGELAVRKVGEIHAVLRRVRARLDGIPIDKFRRFPGRERGAVARVGLEPLSPYCLRLGNAS